MLCLSRKVGEGITIGRDTVVKVIDVRGRTVRLGIAAPREVPIVRNELSPISPARDASTTSEVTP